MAGFEVITEAAYMQIRAANQSRHLEISQSEGQVSLSQSRSATSLQGAGGLVAQLMAFTSDLFFCRRSPTVLEARIETII